MADDFGRSAAINRAVIEAHARGGLHGASLMLGQPATADAVARAREHPRLQIGWHLHLCDSQPLTCSAWPWGSSPTRAGGAIGLTPGGRRLMRAEVAAQWDAFQATGLRAAFINSHHHLHVHPVVWGAIGETVAESFDGWMRLGDVCRFGKRSSMQRHADRARSAATTLTNRALDRLARWQRHRCHWTSSRTLWGIDRLRQMNAAEIRMVIATLPAGLHEFMFHPGNTENDADFKALLELRS